jgi:energy-coupling factor transporter ATP-binding protein EcfA2
MDIDFLEYKLTGLNKINIVLGKNGCGKSTLLTQLESHLLAEVDYFIKYVTPERAGTLIYEPQVERNIESNDKWLSSDRRKNQTVNFKQQSISQYRKLQLFYYQELDKNMTQRKDEQHTFDKIILGKINSLLENIEVRPSAIGIEAYKKGTDEKIPIEKISRGESELISLAIECLSFSREAKIGINNILLLDEPDVHLHPDLQYRLGKFLKTIVEETDIKIILATHSTAFIGAFTDFDYATFGIMKAEQKDINFKNINTVYKRILPVFGAHPLSNIFNKNPILLIEGEDDLRVWQQAIRTSEGFLKIYPVDIDGIDNFAEYETGVLEIINSIYDTPVAYSLRDRDEILEDIVDILPLIRFRLNCRAAENLFLTDEVLESLGTNWITFVGVLEKWIENRVDHPRHKEMIEFKDSGYDRRQFNLKKIRNILVGETGTNKPWEVAIGQVLGRLAKGELNKDFNDFKISSFLGEKLANELIK